MRKVLASKHIAQAMQHFRVAVEVREGHLEKFTMGRESERPVTGFHRTNALESCGKVWLLREPAGVNSFSKNKCGAHGSDHRGLARQIQPLADTVDGFNSCAMCADQI